MPPDSVKKIKEKAVAAALDLAAKQGWNAVTLQSIAKKAKIPLSTLHDHFEDRLDLITAWGRLLDQKVIKAASAPDATTSPRDRLFDILMERFDALNETRAGSLAILHSFKQDPKSALISLPHLGRSMSWMLEAACIECTGLKGALKIAALTALYLKTLSAWCDDDSEDLGKTMAALDKNLGHAEHWAERFGFSA